nr:unnamed protein product [Callosobruchus analis]
MFSGASVQSNNSTSFKKSISRLRWSRPGYTATWDPTPLLTYIENLPSPLSLKTLSYKLTTLLALITGERLQTISLIRLSNIIQGSRETVINISDLTKTSRTGKAQPCLHIPIFPQSPLLCGATILKEYIKRTVPLRHPDNDFLFITHKIPHGRASKDTLSR